MADALPLLKPKDFILTDEDGAEKRFVLSKFDAVAGREIACKYPLSALPKLGDYAVSEETMFKLMHYVGVEVASGNVVRLGNRAMINNHVGDWESLWTIEKEMLKYNCSFFRDGRASTFLEDIAARILQKISEISTPSSAPSSPAEKQL